ncbi:hypothetical protein [Cohnella lupini]|uniref:Uncharacterized protein n=1 Tax=Cohnella lupini TaxID=1294267 RepID=A0A3D9IUS9_9BACL|nr:hypothetical protein [Cohnella lupini]RED65530.1 hypothetical protein DFP95_10118 [Cohnella lupini]
MTKGYKWLLFISSYAPLYVLLGINNYRFESNAIEFMKAEASDSTRLAFWATILVLFAVSFAAIGYFRWIGLNERRSFQGLKPINESVLSYMISYVVPLTALNIDSVNSLAVNAFLFLIFGIVYVNNDLLYLNILLILFGYKVYADASGDVIITNYSKDRLTVMMNNGEPVSCRKVVKGVYLLRRSS